MIWNNKALFILGLFLLGGFAPSALNAQIPKPASEQDQSILLYGATAHLGNGKVIDRAAIGFREGKLDLVLSAIDVRVDTSKYDTIIHLEGKELYPGFIAPNSRLGLVEIDAVRASRDYDDVGLFNPHVRALTAFNTESRISPTIRTNGVLLAQVTPKGGRISGSSSVFQLEGWNWEDAVLRKDDGIHLNWPYLALERNWQEPKKQKEAEEKYQEQVYQLEEFFQRASAYSKSDFLLEKDLRLEAMRDLFSGKQKLFIHADRADQITDVVYFFEKYEIDLVIVGGYESYLVAELLKDKNIPIILRRVHALPMNQDDDVDLPYKLPKMLHDKGLLVGLENSGRMEAMGTRNLPFYAGTAVAYGLEKETAISMLTHNTAKILGIDDKVGSIEEGKDATLFISSGDALDMRTNQLELAFVKGKLISLDNPQKELYQKYRSKYRQP